MNRSGQLFLDLPRFMAWETPIWLRRVNFAFWIVCVPLFLSGQIWAFFVFGGWTLLNFAWGYRAWRAAGSPAIDDTPSYEQALEMFREIWRGRR